MDEVVRALRERGGVASWSELKAVTAREHLERSLEEGTITRIRRNLYVLADLREVRRLAVEAGGVASHLTAAQHWGWKVKDPPVRPCITVARGARRPRGDLEVHWQDLPSSDVVNHITSRVATVVACARSYEPDVALCVADSALREGQVTRTRLERAAAASPRTGRTRALRVVELADARAANPFESVLRWLCSGVPGLAVVPQVEIDGVGRVDLHDERLGIVVEAESWEFHGTRDAFARDVHRYTACARLGLTVARFTWHEVMHRPDHVRAALTDVVRARSARAAPAGSPGPTRSR